MAKPKHKRKYPIHRKGIQKSSIGTVTPKGRGRAPKGVRPPQLIKYQWRRGESGNPKGRPPKARCFRTLLKGLLDSVGAIDEEGNKKTREQLLAEAVLLGAMSGNKTALKEVVDRIYGAVKQEIDVRNLEPVQVQMEEIDVDKPDGVGAGKRKGKRRKRLSRRKAD